jgi:DNA recombination protein RmuC
MQSFAIVFALVAVALFFIGLGIGFRHANSGAQNQLDAAISGERKLAETRESALREQLEGSRAEIAALRPKAEERERFKAQTEERETAIQSLRDEKAELEAGLRLVVDERDTLGRKLATAEQRLRDEETKYAQMRTDLDTAFKGAAADALRANTQSFLELAKQELGSQTRDAKQALEAKEQAINALLKPLEETLEHLDEKTRVMEEKRSSAYASVETMIEHILKTIPQSVEALRQQTTQLVSALKNPKTRGNWGQQQLERCVEFAGMVEHCSFNVEAQVLSEEARSLRPDMEIYLPNGRRIIVDAKAPLDAFLDAIQSTDADAQNRLLAAHARNVRARIEELSKKKYQEQFKDSPDFVVCFLPSEALFSAALEGDPTIIEFGASNKVIPATPTTLIALLKAVAFGWEQAETTRSADAIKEVGKKLYDKLTNAYGYFMELGKAINNSTKEYNLLLGAIEGRDGAFSRARELGKLLHSSEAMDEDEIEFRQVRQLVAPDWVRSEPTTLPAETET